MTKSIKVKYALICIGLLLFMFALIVRFKTGVSWQDYFGEQMVAQKTILKALNSLRAGQREEAIKILEIKLYLTTHFLPYCFEKDGKRDDDYSELKDVMIQTRDYLDKYDVYGKSDGLISYKAAQKSITDFIGEETNK